MPIRLSLSKKILWILSLAFVSFFLATISTLLYPPQDIIFKNGFLFDGRIIDMYLFAPAGEDVTIGNFNNVYADKSNQAGPLQLVFTFLLARTGEIEFLQSWYIQSIFIQFLVLFSISLLFLLLSFKTIYETNSPIVKKGLVLTPFLIALYLSITSYSTNFYIFGHYWQIGVALLWSFAGFLLVKGRPILAGLVLALSTSLEPWAILGCIFLIISPRIKPFVLSGLTAVLGMATIWLSFFTQQSFSMGKYEWIVKDGTFWSLFMESGTSFSWTQRFLQGSLVLIFSILLAFLVRRKKFHYSSTDLWALLFILSSGIILARVCFDPMYIRYYLFAPQALLLVAGLSLLFARNFKVGFPVVLSALALLMSYDYGPIISGIALFLIIISLSFNAAPIRIENKRKNTVSID